MFLYFAQGVGLGFAGGVQPGPFQTYIISQTLRQGWRRTLPVALAPLVSDGPIIALVLFALNQVPAPLRRFLHLASAIVIGYLAWEAFRTWRSRRVLNGPSAPARGRSFGKAVLMNFVSPGPYIYWSLVAGPALLRGWSQSAADGIAFLVGFYGTLVTVFAGTVVLFGLAARLGPRVNQVLVGVAALALAGFALYQLWLGLTMR